MTRNSRRSPARMLLALPLLFIGSGALAQTAAPLTPLARLQNRLLEDVAARAEVMEARDRRIVQSQGPSDTFGFAPNAPQFQLSANRADGEASLVLTAEIGRTRANYDPTTGDDRRTSWTSRFYLRGIAPLGDDKDADRFVNLANPLDGSRITIGFVHYFSNYTIHRADVLGALTARINVVGDCLNQAVAGWRRGPRTPEEIALAEHYLSAYRAHLTDEPRPELALLDVNTDKSYADIPDDVKTTCLTGQDGSDGDFLAMIGHYGAPADADVLLRSVTGNAPTYFFGGEATASQHDFSFLNRTTFAVDDESHRGYALSAFGGVIGGNGRWSLRAGVTATRSYDAQDPIELCRPVTGTTDLHCITAPDGAPTRNNATVATAEGRALIATPLGDIGIAPVFAIDARSGDYTVDVPVYLARGADNRLTGGLRAGYSSKKDNFSFGFFIGVPFDLPNLMPR